MSSVLSNCTDETLLSSSDDFSTEMVRIGSSKKKSYCGLQDDSRKKSKKKHWKAHENRKYVEFLRNNMSLFERNREDKRLMRINILMSNHVRSKNSTQCRSHHQKMLAHYKTIDNIILRLCADDHHGLNEVPCAQEAVPVGLEQEELVEEFEEIEEQPLIEKDVFEVLDNSCWGYDCFAFPQDF
jgi:hypothetical protein